MAVVAVFCVSVAEILVGRPVFEEHRMHVAGAFVLCGVIAWFVGRHRGKKNKPTEEDESSKAFVIFDLRYWGPMFVVLGVITLFIQTLTPVKSAPRPSTPSIAQEKVDPPVPEAPVIREPVTFPNLKIQGLIIQNNNSVVILNGKSYGVGDRVEDVTVKEITRTTVLVEKEGVEKWIPFTEAGIASAKPVTAER